MDSIPPATSTPQGGGFELTPSRLNLAPEDDAMSSSDSENDEKEVILPTNPSLIVNADLPKEDITIRVTKPRSLAPSGPAVDSIESIFASFTIDRQDWELYKYAVKRYYETGNLKAVQGECLLVIRKTPVMLFYVIKRISEISESTRENIFKTLGVKLKSTVKEKTEG